MIDHKPRDEKLTASGIAALRTMHTTKLKQSLQAAAEAYKALSELHDAARSIGTKLTKLYPEEMR
jgi:hypothetical protein